jgi:hypothetical protein
LPNFNVGTTYHIYSACAGCGSKIAPGQPVFTTYTNQPSFDQQLGAAYVNQAPKSTGGVPLSVCTNCNPWGPVPPSDGSSGGPKATSFEVGGYSTRKNYTFNGQDQLGDPWSDPQDNTNDCGYQYGAPGSPTCATGPVCNAPVNPTYCGPVVAAADYNNCRGAYNPDSDGDAGIDGYATIPVTVGCAKLTQTMLDGPTYYANNVPPVMCDPVVNCPTMTVTNLLNCVPVPGGYPGCGNQINAVSNPVTYQEISSLTSFPYDTIIMNPATPNHTAHSPDPILLTLVFDQLEPVQGAYIVSPSGTDSGALADANVGQPADRRRVAA